jgi:hypothetical protein
MQMLEIQNRRDYLGRAGVDGTVMLLKMPFVIDAVSLDRSYHRLFEGAFCLHLPSLTSSKRWDLVEKNGILVRGVNVTEPGLVQRWAVVKMVLCVRVP